MEYKAIAKNIKMSPRKVRLVADALRNLGVEDAVKKLNFLEKRAATPMKKTIESAIANAVNNSNAKRENLKFKEVKVDEGITYKRYRFASRGRVAPYLRRTSHITVVLEDNIELPSEKAPVVKKVEKKAIEKSDEKAAKTVKSKKEEKKGGKK